VPGSPGKKAPLTGALLLIPLTFAADRLIKSAVLSKFSLGESLPVIPGIFHLTRVDNPGAAFGMLRGRLDLLIPVSALCAIVLGGRLLLKLREAAPKLLGSDWASALVAGGALGNLYDRLVYGHVIDYLDFRVWPVFNFADSCITAGVAIALFGLFSEKGKA
jgi:signal peptidase II